jgi:DNA polymerase-1
LPGKVLIVSDLSQIELRVLAHFTQDKQLLKAYRNNLDLHSLLAARVFGEDFTPLDRTYAKNGNFSILFGASPATLVTRYGFPSIALAKRVQTGFYSTYKAVEPWKQQLIAEALVKSDRKKRIKPYVETILGRKRRLPELLSRDRGDRSAAERQAVSSVIQGSAADLFKVGMIDCFDSLQQQKWEGHILMTVHDELVVEVPERYAEEGLILVKSAMENVCNPFTGDPILSLPIVADAHIVVRWSDAKGQPESHKSKGGKEKSEYLRKTLM